MFYQFAARVVRGLIWLINGKVTVLNRDQVPEGEYVLVGPHRTWWDPLFFAAIGFPTVYMFMAKKELFKNPILGWIIKSANGFSVDRDNPGPSVIKIPVKGLKKGNMSLIIFPSGSRHSSDMKDGALLIAKLAKKPIVPLVYQGPLKFSGLFKRNNVTLAYGTPIDPNGFSKNKETASQEFDQVLKTAFQQLDQSIDPNFVYIDQK
ncbi:1-acyl-sn-glycerol-3-phosphate acyltransferase [Weissella coleopterorum]|uniref:1-acyl-sn-glycerol-3-phosphate acyltransferase n=1 Tax=Weissella coleopterorum TaxID=2714949 RepID=A0A6G8B105_9LACO|nr:1-acyl-sn-glycerol-3-phosphate acyltransferase [Weissella coleopterorum]QIL50902.1 1-acyl-sn-glycerol-3-phosphate acyltransferase [Weissella coleopterorum]